MSYFMLPFILIIDLIQETKILAFKTYGINNRPLFSHVSDLSSLYPNCEDGIINSLKYISEGTYYPEYYLHIDYTCTSNTGFGTTLFSGQTSSNPVPDSAYFNCLAGLDVGCPTNYGLSYFRALTSGGSVWYTYKCRPTKDITCWTDWTGGFGANGSPGIAYWLDYLTGAPRLGDTTEDVVIRAFKLHLSVDGWSMGTYRYEIRRCKVIFCDIACSDCYSSYTYQDCINCNMTLGYYPLEDIPRTCINYLRPTYYFAGTYWGKCQPQCLTCTGRGSVLEHLCITCQTGYYPLQDNPTNCYATRQYGYFFNVVAQRWDKCYFSCDDCTGLGDEADHFCKTCAVEYYKLEDKLTKCYSVALYGYYFNFANQIFELCYPTCQYCTGRGSEEDHKCITCIHLHFPTQIKLTSCISTTPYGYFFNDDYDRYDKCNPRCASCTGLGDEEVHKCITCIPELIPIEDTSNCVSTCPDGFYRDDLKASCVHCNINCETCVTTSVHCLTCYKEWFLDKNECIRFCPDGFFGNISTKTCDKCDETCETCLNEKDYCLTCIPNLYYLNNTCLVPCPDGYYNDALTMTCQKCYEKCQTCKGGGKSDCLSCVEDFPYLLKGLCTDLCLDEELPIFEEKKCLLVSSCIKSFTMKVPYRFNIEFSDFITETSLKIQPSCERYANLLKSQLFYHWENTYQGYLLEGGTKLIIPLKNLESGLKTFVVKMMFNNIVISSLITNSQFKKNRLIPVVKNINSLNFIYGYPIIIDASLSFDEGLIDDAATSNINDPELIFKWECPNEISINCTHVKESKLVLKADDYTGLQSNVRKLYEYSNTIYLSIFKGNRTNKIGMTFTLSIPRTEANGTVSEDNRNYADFLVILPRTRGMRREDLIFETIFLDASIQKEHFFYYWTVANIKDPTKYLNGRKEDIMRIKNEDFFLGENEILLRVDERNNSAVQFTKKYIYTKSQAPYGGNCQVNPNIGLSLKTTITFSANEWRSSNQPLGYKFYMTNQNEYNISLVDDYLPISIFTSWIIPAGNKFYVEVVDSVGLTSIYPCSLMIIKNTTINSQLQSFNDLSSMLESIDNIHKRLMLIEALWSNNFMFDVNGIEMNINLLNQLIDWTSDITIKQSVNRNIDLLLSNVNWISASGLAPLTYSYIEILKKLMNIIITNMAMIVQDPLQVEGLINIVNRNFDMIQFSNRTMNITQEILANDNYLRQMQLNINDNMIPGQFFLFSNNNFAVQVAKLSRINIQSYSVVDTSDSNYPRLLQQSEEGCLPNSAMCFSSDLVKNISSPDSELGILTKINKKINLLPISDSSFGLNSLEMNIAQKNTTSSRMLLSFSNELTIPYTIRLKAPNLNMSSVGGKINDTACVQYDSQIKSDAKSCTTWYDYDTMEIVCQCHKQGLTVNVLDKTLSSFSKLAQFPSLDSSLLNVYSVSIIGTFILLLLIMLIIAHHKDSQDNKRLIYMNSEQYDIIQHYLIEFTKEGFNKEYTLMKLYWYTIKTNHPLITIISIFSTSYYRTVRVLDFFLVIYLSFFFTFLPMYATDNEVKIQNESSRSIKNMGLQVDQLGVTIGQIINGVIYSIIGSIITSIITLPLNLLMYSDVIKDESTKRMLLMQNLARRYLRKKELNFYHRISRGIKKVKVFLVLAQTPPPLKSNTRKVNKHWKHPDHSNRNISESSPKRSFEFGDSALISTHLKEKNHSDNLTTLFTVITRKSLSKVDDVASDRWVFSQHSLEEDENVTRYQICVVESFYIPQSRIAGNTTKTFISIIQFGEREFLFKIENVQTYKITCFSFSIFFQQTIVEKVFQKRWCKRIISLLKIFIILGIDVLAWIYLAQFIVGIYNNFGSQIIQLCIMPIISVFVTKLIFISNLRLFLSTVLMYYFGPYIYSKKALSISGIIFNLLVPPIASSHHHAILLFRLYWRNFEKKVTFEFDI